MGSHVCYGAECPKCGPFSLKNALPARPPGQPWSPPPDPERAIKLATFRDSRGLAVPEWPVAVIPSTTVIVTMGGMYDTHCGVVLVHQRPDNEYWGFVGGIQEVGESIEACARRETLEETGLVVRLRRLVCVDSDPCQGAIGLYPAGPCQFCNLTFLATVTSGVERPSHESLQLAWCHPACLPEPFLPTHAWRLSQAMTTQKVQVR